MTLSEPTVNVGPPGGRWSIVTLAEHLRVSPAAVDALLADPDQTEESPDFRSARSHHTYRDAAGTDLGDVWLHDEASERIAVQLPAARVARLILADDGADPCTWITREALHALAQHVLEHGGAEVTYAACSVTDCTLKVSAKGMCNKHYLRWCTRGTTDLHKIPTDAEVLSSSITSGPVPEHRPDLGHRLGRPHAHLI